MMTEWLQTWGQPMESQPAGRMPVALLESAVCTTSPVAMSITAVLSGKSLASFRQQLPDDTANPSISA